MSVAFASPPRLAVRTVELRDRRPLLSHLPAAAPLCWLRGGDGLVAWGEAARLELPAEGDSDGVRRFSEAARLLRGLFADAEVDDAVDLPGTGPVAFASFTFDARSNGSVLVVPSVVAGRRDGHTWLTTIGGHRPGSHPGALTVPGAPLRPVGPLTWGPGSLTAEEWCGAVGAAVDRIRGGGLGKAVLARDAFADAERAIDPRTLLGRLAAAHPECYTFAVDGLVGATPELLLRRDGDRVESLVLAGTRRRGATEEEDAALAEDMLSSAKDGEEHRFAVESLRAALGPLATEVVAPAEPELLRLANVQHLASPASAELRPGVSTLDAVAALHPTAAVGGTPTAEAVELIRELEGMDRGRYAGPVGWIDAQGRGEWAIALRCAHVSGSRARLFAGCGIVAGSEPQAELAEADSKFRVMAEALTDR